MIGRKLSHFRILAKIGEGGMGVVYRAEDEKLGRQVALKVLQPEAVGNEERRLRFLREARSAAAVSHPHIATVHEIDEIDGVIFIAMELVEGRTLGSLIDGGPLPRRDALRYAIEIAEALARAHAAGVVHRDLKPDNVVVTSDRHVKILDFGLAKVIEPEPVTEEADRIQTISAEMTRAGRILGTAAYMSPEQARGTAVDARSDVFSFGVMLYEMVTGTRPFRGETPTDILAAVVRDQPAPLIRLQPEASPELDRIVSKCIEKAPEDRYQHAEEMVVDLRKLKRETDSQPLTRVSGPATAIGSGRPAWLRPVPMAIAAGVLAVVALIAVVVIPWGGEPSGDGVRSLAVLPLANLKDAEDPERLGQILQELIITDLSELESLSVFSSQRLFDIQAQLGRKESRTIDRELATEIASRAGAGTMLTGSLSRLGERWILACQLVNVVDGAVIKSERIDGTDLYSMVDRLTAQIRDDLGLDPAARDDVGLAVAEKTTASLEAYQRFLSGVELLNARKYKEAVLELHRAISIDPAFGQAHYKLAVAGWWYKPGEAWWTEHGIPDPEETLGRLQSGEIKLSTKDRRLAEAMLPLVRQDYDDAVRPFERLVAQYPDEKEAWYGLGEALYHGQTGSQETARAAFEKALELDPSFYLAYTHLFDIYGATRDYEEGVERARALIEADPESSSWYGEWVAMSIRKGDGEAAEAALEEALRHVTDADQRRHILHDAGHAFQSIGDHDRKVELFLSALETESDVLQSNLLTDLAWHYRDRLDDERAMKYLRAAHELAPGMRPALDGLFRIYDRQRNYGDAILEIRGLIKKHPDEPFLYTVWARAAVHRGDEAESARAIAAALEHAESEQERVVVYVEASEAYAAVGDFVKATELADRALSIDPDSKPARTRRAWMHDVSREFDAALERFEDLFGSDPGRDFDIELGILRARLHLGRFDEALALAEEWPERYPNNHFWRDEYFRALLLAGRLQEAESFYESSQSEIRNDVALRGFISESARVCLDAADFVRAERLARTASEMVPGVPSQFAFFHLGKALTLQGRYREAVDAHERGVERFPRASWNLLGRARARLLDGDARAAVDTARAVLASGPHLEASRLLAHALAEQGRYEEAASIARDLLAKAPLREHHTLLAWVLIAGGIDLERGIDLAETALGLRAPPHAAAETYPYMASARHCLGLAYLRRGERDKAISMLTTAANERPDRPSIRDHLEQARAK